MATPYSGALLAHGPLLFLSGRSPEAPDGDVAGDVAGQTRQVFANMEQDLRQYGSELCDLIKLTYYLRHIADLEEFHVALGDCLPDGIRPVGTLVEVSGLIDPRHLVHVEGVACLSGERR